MRFGGTSNKFLSELWHLSGTPNTTSSSGNNTNIYLTDLKNAESVAKDVETTEKAHISNIPKAFLPT
jgi:hypothetical protein